MTKFHYLVAAGDDHDRATEFSANLNSKGYTVTPIKLDSNLEDLLLVGGDWKNEYDALVGAHDITQIVGPSWAPSTADVAEFTSKVPNYPALNLMGTQGISSMVPIILDSLGSGKVETSSAVLAGPSKPEPEGVPAQSAKSEVTAVPANEKSNGTPSPSSPAMASPISATLHSVMGRPADVSALLAGLDEESRAACASQYVAQLVEARSIYKEEIAWMLSPEAFLFQHLGPNEKSAIAREILRKRSDVSDMDRERVRLLRQVVDIVAQMKSQMAFWEKLALLAPKMLIATSVFSALAVGTLFALMFLGRANPLEASVVIFALALFAASPAVLLLNERPLEGIDKWMPASGKTESKTSDEEKKEKKSGINAAD